MANALTEKRLHLTFEVSILLKGLHAVIEIFGGLLFLVNKTLLIASVWLLTLGELGEDPQDFLANYVLKTAHDLSISAQHFAAVYLLSHGIIKLAVVIGLFKKNMWAYPTSIIVFTVFIIYQLYRYHHTHSVWLLIFTIFDIIVIYLTVHEWRVRRMHLN